jgi:serine/threonine-protein kinase
MLSSAAVADDDPLASAPTQLGGTLVSSVTPGAAASETSTLAPMAEVLAGRYEVLALLGVGGMGRVYRVHDRALDETVALKLLRRELVGAPEMVERFRREVKLARLVTSPHVVRTFDLGAHGDEHFLTMEYVEGRSLANLLEDGARSLEDALRIARPAAAGIAAAHAAGVLHRDLKPDNVLVGNAGRIAITDFGIARASSTGGANAVAETVDRFVGTPAYMAPEQVDGRAAIGPATDVYAFGLVLYEMLVGKRAFDGRDALAVAVARLSEPPPDPRAHRDVPARLAEVVVRCLARDPANRYTDGRALADALADVAALAQPSAKTWVAPVAPIVPGKTSRSVAVLPLRASPELADLAEGLGEEIVDGLTLTRSLRVRPMSAVRGPAAASTDPREVGRALGVDVVVDGSLRKLGEIVRITARAIGVEDGFQLSADRVDAKADELLSAGDAIAKAVARALTVELALPSRGTAIDPRATALYLESKARLRGGWMRDAMKPALELLEQARALAPDDPQIAATIATVRVRDAFYGSVAQLASARAEAERVVARAPETGEAWLALGLAHLYASELAPAARALIRALSCAPGLAQAQAALGGILVEVDSLSEARAHLEAALALDPTSLAVWDLARAYVYEGHLDDALALLAKRTQEGHFAEILIGRFKLWRGERHVAPAELRIGPFRSDVQNYATQALEFYASGSFRPGALEELLATANVVNPRLRASRFQYAVEFLCSLGMIREALDCLDTCVDAGLHDVTWLARCPLLAVLRDEPRFIAQLAQVTQRARGVTDVLGLHHS